MADFPHQILVCFRFFLASCALRYARES